MGFVSGAMSGMPQMPSQGGKGQPQIGPGTLPAQNMQMLSNAYNLVGPQGFTPQIGQSPMNNLQGLSNMTNIFRGLPQPQPGQMPSPQDYETMYDRAMNPPQPFLPQQPQVPAQGGKGQDIIETPRVQPPMYEPGQQPMNPYEGMTQVGPGSYERLDGSPGSMQPSTSMTPLQKSMMDRYNPQRLQRPQRPQMPQRPQVQPANPQRGLGGLQTDKFRRRLG